MCMSFFFSPNFYSTVAFAPSTLWLRGGGKGGRKGFKKKRSTREEETGSGKGDSNQPTTTPTHLSPPVLERRV